jgi:hypothetical protein
MRRTILALSLLALVLFLSYAARAESPPRDNAIAARIGAMNDGKLHMSFEAREGVWGDGKSIMTFSDDDDRHNSWSSRRRLEQGPVRVLLTMHDGEVTHIKTRVGRQSKLSDRVVDLGEVDSIEAAEALMWLAKTARRDVAGDAIDAAVLAAHVELWPELLPIARDRDRPSNVRETALFWLSQEAGEKVAEELQSFVDDDDEDLEVRESAIFALSQRPSDESVPALIRIAKTNDHPELRKNALFWLAQHDDERVVDLFEEILTN